MNGEMTLLEKAKKAVENFEPRPYPEVDKSLREGSRNVLKDYKENITKTLKYMAALD